MLSGSDNWTPNINIKTVTTLFLDKPYVRGTLDIKEVESLVINTDSVDCTTFVEYVLASLVSGRLPDKNDLSYRSALQKIRYRNGTINDYSSRLHYFTDWINENQKNGFILEVTDQFEIGRAHF